MGFKIGLLPEHNYNRCQAQSSLVAAELIRLQSVRNGSLTLEQILRRPETRYCDLTGADTSLPLDVIQKVEIETKYAGYLQRQEIDVTRLKSLDIKKIPSDFDYHSVCGLGNEARQKLREIQPGTLGQASRISGITPADIGLLSVWLKRVQVGKGCESDAASI